MTNVAIDGLRDLAHRRLEMVDDGEALTLLERSLIAVGLAASVTSLDAAAIDRAISEAFAAGATVDQVQEIVTLISALGVHSLMATSATIARLAAGNGWTHAKELDNRQSQLWDKYIGDDPYWTTFREAMPGFLESLIRLSPDQFEAFFTYCQLPWKSNAVRARTKELVALACDATPAHRFRPGFLLHLDNAIAIGVGRRAIMETLAMAADAPAHRGFA